MKHKFISILLTLVLVLSFSLVTAVPVAAAVTAITSTDVEGPYFVGVEQGFSVRTTSDVTPPTENVIFKFVVADAVVTDIASFDYFDAETAGWVFPESNPDPAATDTWIDMPLALDGTNLVGYFGPSGGFLMPAEYDVTTFFKINFKNAKTYEVTVSLETVPPDPVLIISTLFTLEVEPDYTTDYTAAVLKAADRLAATQNDDGGFDWFLDADPESGSCTNLGIAAIGILKGYEIEAKASYETALGKAYMYAVDKVPAWTFNDSWTETTGGVNSFPDVTFMIWLARAAAHDVSLLGAINTEVPGTTAASIAALAKTRWDDRVLHLGSTNDGTPDGTAIKMAEYLRDKLVPYYPWDLEAAVKAALALDARYPGEGYNAQATSIANVIFTSVDAPGFFISGDTNQTEYVLGLTGTIEAFVEVNLYLEKASELKDLLINIQQPDGSWKLYGGNPYEYGGASVDYSVQSTAYAVMALLRQGESDAIAAAQKGAEWLVLNQISAAFDGGWYGEGGIPLELPEMNSEAAWALKTMLDRFSASVGMIAGYTPQIGIRVDPTWVDFGDVVPGTSSAPPREVTVTNLGNVAVDLSASIINESPIGVYTAPFPDGLTIDMEPVGDWYASVTAPGDVTPELILTVPPDTAPGTYTAILVFWAEQP